MYDEDAFHKNKSLQQKLQHIFELRRDGGSRINFEDNSFYQKLLENLDHPEEKLPPVIHVAGTNGKGSVIATLRAILEAEGYKVHAYTSPHLIKFNERLYIAGQHISDSDLEALLDEVFERNEDNPVTFFEFTTALAFLAFSRTPADVVLLETGMGGRLDCSNIIKKPLATVITPISYDHMEFLGDTIPKIAAEKAGIIKEDVPCISSPQTGEALEVLKNKAKEKNAAFFASGETWSARQETGNMIFEFDGETKTFPRPNLIGAHQIQNAGTALATLKVVKKALPVSDGSIETGLQQIIWPGRMEQITSGKYHGLLPANWELWFDGGHNVAGARSIASILKKWKHDDGLDVHIFLGMKETKDIEGVKSILGPVSASLTEFPNGTDITEHIKKLVSAHKTTHGKVVICGSLYNYIA